MDLGCTLLLMSLLLLMSTLACSLNSLRVEFGVSDPFCGPFLDIRVFGCFQLLGLGSSPLALPLSSSWSEV